MRENCSTLSNTIKNVIDRHAPIKTRKIRNHSSPAMNGEWRRAIYKKNMLKNNFFKFKSQSYWEAYRRQRNYCTRLKKISIKKFFCVNAAMGVQNHKIFGKQLNLS